MGRVLSRHLLGKLFPKFLEILLPEEFLARSDDRLVKCSKSANKVKPFVNQRVKCENHTGLHEKREKNLGF